MLVFPVNPPEQGPSGANISATFIGRNHWLYMRTGFSDFSLFTFRTGSGSKEKQAAVSQTKLKPSEFFLTLPIRSQSSSNTCSIYVRLLGEKKILRLWGFHFNPFHVFFFLYQFLHFSLVKITQLKVSPYSTLRWVKNKPNVDYFVKLFLSPKKRRPSVRFKRPPAGKASLSFQHD